MFLQEPVDKLYGKYAAVVVDNKDEDHMGRITVSVPQLDDMQFLARPCLPYGHFFIPPEGTRVWVEFEGGNALEKDSAIWVGAWYLKGKTPAEASISPPDNRVIQTASGHTIELMDKDGEEKITIRHKDNSFISIDKNGSVLIANQKGSHISLNAKDENATFMEQHGNLITMTGDGIVLVNKNGAVLELKGDLVRVAANNIVLQGSSVALGAGAAEPTILGTTFATIYGVHTHATAVGPSGPPVPPVISPNPRLTSAVVVK